MSIVVLIFGNGKLPPERENKEEILYCKKIYSSFNGEKNVQCSI